MEPFLVFILSILLHFGCQTHGAYIHVYYNVVKYRQCIDIVELNRCMFYPLVFHELS